ncbi:MAG TPA: ABC transporter ATP-binding protein [Acidimicrobiia bacterium]|jgi:ABC-2 type transport system ATP-binding protein|nr:ABC transporter ATP-binding protein [Acidimicrobiia bacterium]
MSGPAIRVGGLHKRYGKTVALNGLDFEIPSGQLTGFLGPNGAGKTTTFRCILGLTRRDAGEIEVLGMPVPAGLPEIVKRVGVIIEEPGVIKSLSGRANLAVAADTLGFGHDRIDEMLEFVGLADDASRKAGDYSKGMRQRLALAAAILGDPQLLILDEPLDGLDPAGQHAFRARLRDLAADGRTVVVSSHDLADVEALADHVIVIDEGRLVTQGPLNSLLEGGATRVKVSDPGRAAEALRAAGLDVDRDAEGVVVRGADGAVITETLARVGIYPDEVRVERSTLESVFLGLTGTDVR